MWVLGARDLIIFMNQEHLGVEDTNEEALSSKMYAGLTQLSSSQGLLRRPLR